MNNESARRIRTLRVTAGFNQTEVADESGHTRQELSFIESGKVEVSQATYDAIERAIVRLMERRTDHVGKIVALPERNERHNQQRQVAASA